MLAPRINSNASFERASGAFNRAERALQFSRTRLASGMRINSGRDDGGRLAISEGMRAQLGGLTEGTRNTEKAIDLLRTAEGAMGEISSVLLRMRELATQSATDTLNDTNREAVHSEFNQLKEYIDRIANLASYNGQNLLTGFGTGVDAATSTAIDDLADNGVRRINLSSVDAGTYTFVDNGDDHSITLGNGTVTQTVSLGSIMDGDRIAAKTTVVANFDQLGIEVVLAGQDVAGAQGSYTDGDLDDQTLMISEGTGGSFQLGSDAVSADRLEYDIRDLSVGGPVLNIEQLSVGTRTGSRFAMEQIDSAIERVAKERGTVGAILNRLQYTLNFTESAIQSVAASEGTVRDADFAVESSTLAKGQILQDLSRSAMVQARLPVDTVMSLLTA